MTEDEMVGVLQSMGSKRVRYDLATNNNDWQEEMGYFKTYPALLRSLPRLCLASSPPWGKFLQVVP